MPVNQLPLVSVVIPAYNRPHYLKTALISVINQTYPNLEVIICDDSTNDEVQTMVIPFLKNFPYIKYFKNERNFFIENWHKCFSLASGEFINYLMDDDVFHINKIEYMMSYLLSNKEITLATSYRPVIDQNGNNGIPIEATQKIVDNTTIFEGKQLGNYVLTNCLNVIGEPTTVLFRKRDLKEKFGYYKGKQYVCLNDVATWLSLLSKGKAVYIADPLSYFRMHSGQNSHSVDIALYAVKEWLDLIIDSRQDGFLNSVHLFKTALHTHRQHVQNLIPYYQDASLQTAITEVIQRIDSLLSAM
ncbi:glycosyltransferase family 2 protein [Aneurinibacillus sp. Ricciae_BoGa-3]|uniref:glycosyltransferase family 2 protein n=1 Tax=Aneurinibacillus sp. Ricciae_BoGa-3 TaxID=3022697 RepID=UPI0023415215|nr:glycosyltransferase family 2 protein [Aneurinibacillus sp. Ricciae_BoGa-3]WCK56178.1 glycosyltransferase family 2 protein [Aneurinibacillus sp. Ricciae_BoGa-3]